VHDFALLWGDSIQYSVVGRNQTPPSLPAPPPLSGEAQLKGSPDRGAVTIVTEG